MGEIFQCHWTLPNDTEENTVSFALAFLIILNCVLIHTSFCLEIGNSDTSNDQKMLTTHRRIVLLEQHIFNIKSNGKRGHEIRIEI